MCVNPANASALRTSSISCPWTLSRSSGSRVASAGAPLAGASGYRMIESRPGRRLTITYLGWYVVVKMPRVLGIVEFGTKRRGIMMNMGPVNSTKECMCLEICVRRTRNQNESPQLALITSAPSPPPVTPEGVVKALRLACTIIEFGRATELEVCEPKRSSGSQRSCCIRSTASCDTCGSAGKRRDCFQFKIFCRVT